MGGFAASPQSAATPWDSQIFLKYLCRTLFLGHGTMPLGILGCSRGARGQMNSYVKTLLQSIGA